MTMYKSVRLLLLPCLFLLFVCLPIVAQTTNATLSGVVEDEKGAVIPGVKVTIVNLATGLQRSVVTDGEGAYIVPLLPPATYTVTAERTGFTRVQFPNVILNVNDQRSLRIELAVGSVEAAIEVRPDETLVSTSPAVATTIDRTFVGNLPLNGRSFSSLVLLTPGVTVAAAAPPSQDAGQFSVNGQRASTNYFTVDGVGANIGVQTNIGGPQNLALSGAYPGQNAFGGTNNLVSIDALEEFKIQTSGYTAENGRQPGGQVQIVTRSGTNDFHGSLFEYFRNEALDARNYFNYKPAPKPALRQNQFGGTLGGPLPFPHFGEGGPTFDSGKDRTFFFFSYEGQRLQLPSSGVIDVPSLRLRQVAFPALRPVLNAFPIPTGSETLYDDDFDPTTPDVPSGAAPYNYGLSNPSNLNATSIRIDHSIGTRLSLFGRFNEAPSESVEGILYKIMTIASTRTLTFGATWVLNSRLTNELRLNYSRQRGASETHLTSLGGAVPVDPQVLTSGYSGYGTINFFLPSSSYSLSAGTFADSEQRQINVVDNLSFIKGAHSLKIGFDFRRLSPIYGTQDQQNVSFFSEDEINTGTINLFDVATYQPSRPQFDNYSVYMQDRWQVSRRLLLDLGLRWEINPAPTEAENRLPPLAFGVVGTDVSNATLAPQGTQFYKTFYTAFAPRIGAAYQLRTKQGFETVLRGGFGVYYDLGSGSAAGSWPFNAANFLFGVPFPVSAADAARPGVVLDFTLPTTNPVISPNENLKLPYSLHWNIAVEQSIGKNQTLSLSYVASAGRRLLTTMTLNQRPRNPVTGALLPRPNPNFGSIVFSFNGPTSDYHSMQVQYRARLRDKLQALVNYTWSHAIDEVSSDNQNGVFARGNANFDVRHNFSAALHYNIPMFKAGRSAGAVFRNWSIDTIIHAQSGRPIDAIASSTIILPDGTRLLLRPDRVQGVPLYLHDPSVPGGRRFNVAAFTNPPRTPNGFPIRQGNFGRNVFRELPLYQVDVSLGRTFKFTEKLGIQLKAEAFNVFNHPMFGSYGTSFASPSTFGVPATTMNSSLGGLSSLYQLGGPRSIQLSARLSF